MFNTAERIELRAQAIVLREMGWTYQAIADHIGVPQPTICRWVFDKTNDSLTAPKFKVGDRVVVNGRCPKYILEQIRHNRVRTVVGVFFDPSSGHCFYTLGSNKWENSMDHGWVYFFRSAQLHKPVEGRGPGRPRKKRSYNLRMKCTVTPSNQ